MKPTKVIIASAALLSGLLLSQTTFAASTHWSRYDGRTTGAGGGGFNFNNGPVIGTWDNFADFGDLILKATFDNSISFDNTSYEDGTTIQPWGVSGATATYGQTFIAPVGATKLLDFTFYVKDYAGEDNSFSYQAFVMTWSGSSLLGGSSSNQNGSSIIYASNPLTYTGTDALQAITSSIGGGGLSLTEGNYYLFGLTTLGATAVPPVGPGVNVPDQANSILLLTLGLGAITAVRRRFAKA